MEYAAAILICYVCSCCAGKDRYPCAILRFGASFIRCLLYPPRVNNRWFETIIALCCSARKRILMCYACVAVQALCDKSSSEGRTGKQNVFKITGLF